MKATLCFVALAAVCTAAPLETRQAAGGGDGPYKPGTYSQDSSLTGHTLYKPANASSTKLPVLLWGNGGCSADATGQAPFLQQLASYGVLVIASGTPKGSGQTTAAQMTAGIDWIKQKAGTGAYANVDASRIVASGWSCGGIEAYAQIYDSRVSSIGIWSSGLLNNQTAAKTFGKPVFFFMGGSSDIAYANGERDYAAMPAGVPKYKGNLPVGHGGTYTDVNGGKFGVIGAKWVQWVLRGNATASEYLTSQAAKTDGWSVVSADLDKFKVAPI
ncbi:Alpha/Beta hydrolase protein [Massariosphaeria phaeospora]|uniref:Alpha/Beta hydrolase protein n=1 Tax=Massariosphaeria phaeospora TaxID=100035 RepID=A0A7C8HY71_9PLEO|nr:Alpha/Beta hydrolase protein [Massariosphaeria phaeospora]